MEYWVIDHWEGPVGICHNEPGYRNEIPKEQFPEGMKEGDWFTFMENGGILFSSDYTKKRKDVAKNLRKRLLLQ